MFFGGCSSCKEAISFPGKFSFFKIKNPSEIVTVFSQACGFGVCLWERDYGNPSRQRQVSLLLGTTGFTLSQKLYSIDFIFSS